MIRRAAGLGTAPTEPDPDRYANRFAHCDVLVVGAGPRPRRGARGGRGRRARHPRATSRPSSAARCSPRPRRRSTAGRRGTGSPTSSMALARSDERARCCRAPRRSATTARTSSGSPSGSPTISPTPTRSLPRERLWQVRAKQVVLAAGAIERPLVFPDNDRPGIMLAGAARTYLNRYGVTPGTTRGGLHRLRQRLARGARPQRGRRRRSPRSPICGPTASALAGRRRAPRASRSRPARPSAARGAARVACACGSAALKPDGDGRALPAVACDLVLMSRRLDAVRAPVLAVARQGALRLGRAQSLPPGQPAEAERSAGACRGIFGLGDVVNDGLRAGHEAAPRRRRDGRRAEAFDVDGDDARGRRSIRAPAGTTATRPRPRRSSISRTT